jgi:LuxR family maltose regulon positive regulatory protein
MHLLRTKLNIPHPHADRVERPWLVQRLESGLKARLIVISVPAGSSKTTLVSVWASQCKQPG